MTVTCRAPSRSAAVKVRPCKSGTCSVSRNPVVMMRVSPQGRLSPTATLYPSTVKVDVVHWPLKGITVVAPAPFTPGSWAMRESASSKNRRCEGASGYRARGSAMLKVRRFLGSNPGSTPRSREKLLMRRPAPTSKVSASATSATMSARRTFRPEVSVPERPPSLSASCSL